MISSFSIVSFLLIAQRVMSVAGRQMVSNPVFWEDLADLDIFRLGDAYYYSASTMAYSPGAPLLRSYDLIHWEYMTHSVPVLDFGAKYFLNGSGSAYVEGVWASSLRYRKSNDRFYWIGCVDFAQTHIFTAPGSIIDKPGAPATDWTEHPAINHCYYDCSLLIDDDDSMYVSFGSTNLSVAKLTSDGLSQNYTQVVYNSPNQTYIEGSRFYKINGTYYILTTPPASSEWVLKSQSPWGPYEMRHLADSVIPPVPYAGNPHQGGLIEAPDGQWYYAAFIDSFPGGRVPVLAPISWTVDGWPILDIVNNTWPSEIPNPVKTDKTIPPPTGKDFFHGPILGPQWEWNHNPDPESYGFAPGGGLIMKTATVTDNLFLARNTLTHRVLGPASRGTFQVDLRGMIDGDQVGMGLFRDAMAFIGVSKAGDTLTVEYVDGLLLSDSNNNGWQTVSNGTVAATGPSFKATAKDLWLRIDVSILPAFNAPAGIERHANFSFSFDGKDFKQLGTPFTLANTWEYFIGYRFSLFNFARKAIGGHIVAKSFSIESIPTDGL
ncbi:arabinoxylan hydrolase [Xylogone sp. PMI_703]|nr:arabinoxylan hydrolase [Xylogone sp. PMI_703]